MKTDTLNVYVLYVCVCMYVAVRVAELSPILAFLHRKINVVLVVLTYCSCVNVIIAALAVVVYLN